MNTELKTEFAYMIFSLFYLEQEDEISITILNVIFRMWFYFYVPTLLFSTKIAPSATQPNPTYQIPPTCFSPFFHYTLTSLKRHVHLIITSLKRHIPNLTNSTKTTAHTTFKKIYTYTMSLLVYISLKDYIIFLPVHSSKLHLPNKKIT